MVENTKVSREIINKLRLVEKFIDDLYFGKQQYKPRIAFIGNALSDVIAELEGARSPVQ